MKVISKNLAMTAASLAVAIAPLCAVATDEPAKVVATFAGRSITNKQIETEIKRQPALGYQMHLAGNDQAKVKDVRIAAANLIIEKELLLTAAEKSGLINDKEVQDGLQQHIKQYGGEEQLNELLPQIGTTLDEFKKEITGTLKIRSYLDAGPLKGLDVGDQELRSEFDKDPSKYAVPEQIRARHILVSVPEGAKPEADQAAKQKIEGLLQQVKKPGASFADVASANSDCPSKTQGGDLGFFGRGAMVKEFEDAAFALKTGEISGPVRTKFGYHLIKNEERKAAEPASFESAKKEIKSRLLTAKRAEALRAKIAELRKNADVQISL